MEGFWVHRRMSGLLGYVYSIVEPSVRVTVSRWAEVCGEGLEWQVAATMNKWGTMANVN